MSQGRRQPLTTPSWSFVSARRVPRCCVPSPNPPLQTHHRSQLPPAQPLLHPQNLSATTPSLPSVSLEHQEGQRGFLGTELFGPHFRAPPAPPSRILASARFPRETRLQLGSASARVGVHGWVCVCTGMGVCTGVGVCMGMGMCTDGCGCAWVGVQEDRDVHKDGGVHGGL